jgi:uncharacterized protein with HEPN domain
MTKRDYKLLAQDILDSIDKIESFIGGMEFGDFRWDDKTSNAVIRKLEIIGEAVKHLPPSIKTNHSEIPW